MNENDLRDNINKRVPVNYLKIDKEPIIEAEKLLKNTSNELILFEFPKDVFKIIFIFLFLV